jgi:hypothetical protein
LAFVARLNVYENYSRSFVPHHKAPTGSFSTSFERSLAGFGTDSFRPVNSQAGFECAALGCSLLGLSVAAALATCLNEQLIFYDLNL